MVCKGRMGLKETEYFMASGMEKEMGSKKKERDTIEKKRRKKIQKSQREE